MEPIDAARAGAEVNTQPQAVGAKAVAPGARPEGATGEQEASARVREMFGGIAPRYDLLNHVLSLSLDRLWRRRVARRFRKVLDRADARVLDVCCGTGDLTLALARHGRATIIGSDFAHPMLVRAAGKSHTISKGKRQVEIWLDISKRMLWRCRLQMRVSIWSPRLLGSATSPIMIEDCVKCSASFGPAAKSPSSSFPSRRARSSAASTAFISRRILPRIGAAISGNNSAYSYLPNSVEKFPTPEELARRISAAGFAEPNYELWTGGSVASTPRDKNIKRGNC